MADARSRILPPDVAEKAKEHVLDTLAAMVSGTELPPAKVALNFARFNGGGKTATVVGSDLLCDPAEAAFVNGMLAHADETDDSHSPSHSHPGCSVVPAALATGELFGIDGKHFLRAITLGYDVGKCRDLMDPYLGAMQATELIDVVFNMESLNHIGSLRRLLQRT
jgi:2-methylcitrate dehydratase PrpD